MRGPRLTRGYGSAALNWSEPAARRSNCAVLAHLQTPNIEISPAGSGEKPHRVILIGLKSSLLAGGDPQADRPLPRLTEAHAAPQLDHQEPHQRHYEGRLFKR